MRAATWLLACGSGSPWQMASMARKARWVRGMLFATRPVVQCFQIQKARGEGDNAPEGLLSQSETSATCQTYPRRPFHPSSLRSCLWCVRECCLITDLAPNQTFSACHRGVLLFKLCVGIRWKGRVDGVSRRVGRSWVVDAGEVEVRSRMF